jgi:hypothetical protein
MSFIKLPQGYKNCDRLSACHHPLLNFPDTWRYDAPMAARRAEPWASAHRLQNINLK